MAAILLSRFPSKITTPTSSTRSTRSVPVSQTQKTCKTGTCGRSAKTTIPTPKLPFRFVSQNKTDQHDTLDNYDTVEIERHVEPAPAIAIEERTSHTEQHDFHPLESNVEDIVVIDAVALDSVLYSLDRRGRVFSHAFTKKAGKDRLCPIADAPEKLVAIDRIKRDIIGRGESGRVYMLRPCERSCTGGSCRRTASWRTASVRGEGKLSGAASISTSPDGSRAWIQEGTRGRLYQLEGEDLAPVGPVIDLGDPGVCRTIGDGDEYTDRMGDTAVRNGDPASPFSGVRSIVYTGTEKSRNAPFAVPPGAKRIAVGCVAEFPCNLRDIFNDLDEINR